MSLLHRHLGPAVALLGLALASQAQEAQLSRAVEFEYHPINGQVTLERVDPGEPTCVETAHTLDAYGNRVRTEVRPCASTSPTFEKRVTLYQYAAVSTGSVHNQHPAGAYVTATRTGGASLLAWTSTGVGGALTETRATYDTRFGLTASTTEVAIFDATYNQTKRTQYDSLGRVVEQFAPAHRASGGTLVEAQQSVRYVACASTPPAAPPAGCLNLGAGLQPVPVDYASKRLTKPDGGLATEVPVLVVSAYFVESTPKTAGQVAGATSRVHYDAMHREIAKESESFDKRWTRSFTVYDALGAAAAGYRPHFADEPLAQVERLREWTSHRDLLHRPLQAGHWWRGKDDGVDKLLTATTAYNGLETTATVPAISAPGGAQARQRIVRKHANGKVAQTEDALGATVTLAYDAYDNLVRSVDALGHTTTVAYTRGTGRFKVAQTDPNKGHWSYSYSALGQMLTQTDARGKTATLAYDVLGNMVARATADMSAGWAYRSRLKPDGSGDGYCAGGLPVLCESWTGNFAATGSTVETRATVKRRVYDTLLRVTETRMQVLGDRSYTSKAAFDNWGRLSRITYPSNLAVDYLYSDQVASTVATKLPGVLVRATEAGDASKAFWSIAEPEIAQPFDARGNVVKAKLGNGVITAQALDPLSGKPYRLTAGKLSPNEVLNQRYEYDEAHNLTKRENGFDGGAEQFAYDLLDRMVAYTVNSPDDGADRTVALAYNALGNILRKTDVGGYTYKTNGSNRPHAVTDAGGSQYFYDANGNVERSTGAVQRTHVWADFNQPRQLAYFGNTVDFAYDENHQRIKEVIKGNGQERRQWMLHPDNAGGLAFEREEVLQGSTLVRHENRHYISVGGAVVAVVKTQNALTLGAPMVGTMPTAADQVLYWHRDSLGSIVAVSNKLGAVQERAAFDAWGRRLGSTGRVDWGTQGPAHGDRGYTGHEHLDELALVHMNARVYDPVLARFLSADPVVQEPYDLQNHNAYSYVLNNPLRYTDPSGMFVAELFAAIKLSMEAKVLIAVASAAMVLGGNDNFKMLGSIGLFWALGPAGVAEAGLGVTLTAAQASFIAGATTGFLASGGNLEAAFMEGMFAGITTFAGGELLAAEARTATKMGVHALIGCVRATAGGGACGPGALAGAVSKGATEAGVSIFGEKTFGNFLFATVAGGTASALGGGKFANGAMQGAFGYLFNYLAHVHKDLTYRASRMAGLNPLASDLLSGATVMVDFQGPRFGGDLGIEFAAQDVGHSHMHAMCAGGSSAALCDLKIADYRERMWNMKNMAGLAGLLHLYQDSFAPGHANLQPYNGSVGWAHIKGDMSPPPALASQIIRGSAEIIKNYMNYCQCGPK